MLPSRLFFWAGNASPVPLALIGSIIPLRHCFPSNVINAINRFLHKSMISVDSAPRFFLYTVRLPTVYRTPCTPQRTPGLPGTG